MSPAAAELQEKEQQKRDPKIQPRLLDFQGAPNLTPEGYPADWDGV